MKKDDLIAGIIFMIVSIVLYLQTLKFPKTPVQSTGPSFWPKVILSILFILSVVLIISAFKNLIIRKVAKVEIKEKAEKRNDIIRPLLGIVICTVYLFIFPKAGFIISTFLFFLAVTSLIQTKWNLKNVITMVIQAVVMVSAVYYIFGVFLKVNLPTGIFF